MRKIENKQALSSAYEMTRVLLRRPEKGRLVPGRGIQNSAKLLFLLGKLVQFAGLITWFTR
jgi:hypothetical protein